MPHTGAWNYTFSMTKQHTSGSVWLKVRRGKRRPGRAVCESGPEAYPAWQMFSVKVQRVNILDFTDHNQPVAHSLCVCVALGP